MQKFNHCGDYKYSKNLSYWLNILRIGEYYENLCNSLNMLRIGENYIINSDDIKVWKS